MQAALTGHAGLTPEAALRLQRLAGNRAVGQLVDGSRSAPVVVQRHSSWEHVLLGDTPPGQLGGAAVSREARGHVLSREWARMMLFRDDPGGDPRAQFPDVRRVRLKAGGLWVSYGELNALADYLPDPTTYDTLDRAALVPVLQRMRAGIAAVTGAERPNRPELAPPTPDGRGDGPGPGATRRCPAAPSRPRAPRPAPGRPPSSSWARPPS